mmetsp:Transcript_16086/g.49159  ORF Transcript_16086/g.49159 Transcript_16086/m.49159 type:complete len:335 (-) Transcript_16086:2142-3146(-)
MGVMTLGGGEGLERLLVGEVVSRRHIVCQLVCKRDKPEAFRVARSSRISASLRTSGRRGAHVQSAVVVRVEEEKPISVEGDPLVVSLEDTQLAPNVRCGPLEDLLRDAHEEAAQSGLAVGMGLEGRGGIREDTELDVGINSLGVAGVTEVEGRLGCLHARVEDGPRPPRRVVDGVGLPVRAPLAHAPAHQVVGGGPHASGRGLPRGAAAAGGRGPARAEATSRNAASRSARSGPSPTTSSPRSRRPCLSCLALMADGSRGGSAACGLLPSGGGLDVWKREAPASSPGVSSARGGRSTLGSARLSRRSMAARMLRSRWRACVCPSLRLSSVSRAS